MGARLIDIEHTFATVPPVATTPELERLRRSLAMRAPGQPAGLTREEAMSLLAEVRRASAELDRLVTGLRSLLDERPG
jgi:hypothetical protein